MSSRWFMAILVAFMALATVTAELNTAAPSCDADVSKDHALLQTASSNAHVKKQRKDYSSCGSVQRRRRHEAMGWCRRRHSSPGHSDSDRAGDRWKCDAASNKMVCDEEASVSDTNLVGYPSSGMRKAANLWCSVDIPPAQWNLKTCPTSGSTTVKILTYNLWWWNLFDRRGGSDRSAGRLIRKTQGSEKYDFMAFQECDDRWRVLNDAGLAKEYETLDGGHAIAMAYRKSRWSLLDHDSVEVGEDSRDQYYGTRKAMWARLQRVDGKTIFFMNHHGPLMVSQGGGCTGSATSLNIMRVIGENAHADDVIILVGDFNAKADSSRIQELDKRLTRVFSGNSMGGVDHIFSNCGNNAHGRNLGKGGSDHDALSVTFSV